MVDTQQILKLRRTTGAGMGDCKEALEEAGGDYDKALENLRKKGAKTAAKRADKETKEGVVMSYIHANNKIGSLVEINCETDFVAKNEDFISFAKDIAMQVVGGMPLYVAPEDIPEDILNKEKEMIKDTLDAGNKPPEVIEKIMEGKLDKYFQEVCLLKQTFVKNEDLTIEELLNEKIAALGEKIIINRFCRLDI